MKLLIRFLLYFFLLVYRISELSDYCGLKTKKYISQFCYGNETEKGIISKNISKVVTELNSNDSDILSEPKPTTQEIISLLNKKLRHRKLFLYL